MIFTKEHSKLKNTSFTTIRKNTGYYKSGRTYTIITPSEKFKARVQSIILLKKSDITDELALADADMTADELRSMLESWYGKQYDDFALIKLVRKENKQMPEFEVTITSTFTLDFDDDPTEEDVIDFCRQDPGPLLSEIEVDSINEV